jgi:hypothetical protein
MSNFETFRDRKLSLWQSVVEERQARLVAAVGVAGAAAGFDFDALRAQPPAAAATALAAALHEGAPLMPPPTGRRAAVAASAPGAVVACNRLALQMAWARLQGDIHTLEQLKNEWKFNSCDVAGWAETIEQYVLYYQKNQGSIPYRTGGEYLLDFEPPAQATIALIGDWGTGTTAARELLAQVARKKPDVVFHLGDIYYSGTPFEAQARFLDVCRQTLPAGTLLYTLSGNHDMYSGGAGYYGLVDKLGQQASYFCVRNADWQFLALDTGYNDFNPFTVNSNTTALAATEAAWHRDRIAQAGGRKSVLLSHHPLFSAFEAIGGAAVNANLLGTFQDVLSNIAIWFWGHEHRLEIYAPYAGLQRGRCLGASAIPVFVADDYFDAKFNVPLLTNASTGGQPVRLGNNGTVYNHAYAIMRLDGPKATVEYYQDNDDAHALFEEVIG